MPSGKFFIDVISDDDRCRQLADRITGHRLSPQWQNVKLKLARETRTSDAARGYLDMWTFHDFSKECGKSKAPFLIIGWLNDRCHDTVANFPETRAVGNRGGV